MVTQSFPIVFVDLLRNCSEIIKAAYRGIYFLQIESSDPPTVKPTPSAAEQGLTYGNVWAFWRGSYLPFIKEFSQLQAEEEEKKVVAPAAGAGGVGVVVIVVVEVVVVVAVL